MQNGIDVKKLSDATVKELQDLMGADLSYLIAVDKYNNLTPMSPAAVTTEIGDLNKDNPFKVEVTSMKTLTLGTAATGCCQWMLIGGKWVCVRWGC